MPIDCEVIPRAGARPQELKALGSALLRWYVRECRPDGQAHSVDTEALIEMLNGRPPTPRVPRAMAMAAFTGDECDPGRPLLGGYEMLAPSVEHLREALAEARRPAALLRLRRTNYDRARTIASLRAGLPAALVADVRVDGRSWNSQ